MTEKFLKKLKKEIVLKLRKVDHYWEEEDDEGELQIYKSKEWGYIIPKELIKLFGLEKFFDEREPLPYPYERGYHQGKKVIFIPWYYFNNDD